MLARTQRAQRAQHLPSLLARRVTALALEELLVVFGQRRGAVLQDDPIGPATHEVFGADNYMWASDFPHSDSTFPDSRKWIEKNFTGVPDDVRKRIVYQNAAKLYGVEPNA